MGTNQHFVINADDIQHIERCAIRAGARVNQNAVQEAERDLQPETSISTTCRQGQPRRRCSCRSNCAPGQALCAWLGSRAT